jgi:hypothetical protein
MTDTVPLAEQMSDPERLANIRERYARYKGPPYHAERERERCVTILLSAKRITQGTFDTLIECMRKQP